MFDYANAEEYFKDIEGAERVEGGEKVNCENFVLQILLMVIWLKKEIRSRMLKNITKKYLMHVKGIQKLSLDTYKSVDDLHNQSLSQSFCKVSPKTFEHVVDCEYHENFNLMEMFSEIKLPPKICAASYNVVWNNSLVDTELSENM